MGNFAVIDTETNWSDCVMSIDIVIADETTLQPQVAKYYVLDPEYLVGGMYEGTLFTHKAHKPKLCNRQVAMTETIELFEQFSICSLFAYNAAFDRNHLPELRNYRWHDIMRLAAYRQYNPSIPANADCFSTGRMKRGYGVEAMLRMLTGTNTYFETHNALDDALDELEIIRLLGYPLSAYMPLP